MTVLRSLATLAPVVLAASVVGGVLCALWHMLIGKCVMAGFIGGFLGLVVTLPIVAAMTVIKKGSSL